MKTRLFLFLFIFSVNVAFAQYRPEEKMIIECIKAHDEEMPTGPLNLPEILLDFEQELIKQGLISRDDKLSYSRLYSDIYNKTINVNATYSMIRKTHIVNLLAPTHITLIPCCIKKFYKDNNCDNNSLIALKKLMYQLADEELIDPPTNIELYYTNLSEEEFAKDLYRQPILIHFYLTLANHNYTETNKETEKIVAK